MTITLSVYLELFQIFSKCMESFDKGIKLHKTNDMMKIIGHAPGGEVVKKLFYSIDFLNFCLFIALFFHGGTGIHQYLIKTNLIFNTCLEN